MTIYLADDHELVARGIASLIEKCSENSSISIFKNGKDLFEGVQKNQPDLIFLDYEMPIWNGRTTLVELKKNFPKIPVLILSMTNEKAVVQDCIQLGALGYLNKDCSIDEIKMAIESAHNKTVFYSREVLKMMSGLSPETKSENILLYDLSEREIEILRLLCDGHNPKEIGDMIFLSPRTVEKHKDRIMQKFEVNSIAKLVSFALKNKIV